MPYDIMPKEIEITKIKVERETFFTICPRCGKKITGTSEKMLKSNFKMHQLFCKGKKK